MGLDGIEHCVRRLRQESVHHILHKRFKGHDEDQREGSDDDHRLRTEPGLRRRAIPVLEEAAIIVLIHGALVGFALFLHAGAIKLITEVFIIWIQRLVDGRTDHHRAHQRREEPHDADEAGGLVSRSQGQRVVVVVVPLDRRLDALAKRRFLVLLQDFWTGKQQAEPQLLVERVIVRLQPLIKTRRLLGDHRARRGSRPRPLPCTWRAEISVLHKITAEGRRGLGRPSWLKTGLRVQQRQGQCVVLLGSARQPLR
mmetsp:Transcript_15110/g.57402  ORF Transcript_15110/g.57402 Transcript_15110/m.57402 type:complete len:255 (-) Transcript_15110:3531-4295(-)